MTEKSPLAERLNEISASQPFTVSWRFSDLRTGASAARFGDVPTPSASTRKIAYMMAALRDAHAGLIDLREPVVIHEELMRGPVSGVMYFMTPGLTFPMRDAIVQMIITSDNTCTSIVGDRITVPRLNAFCRSVGMVGTTIRHVVPPRDMPVDSDFDFVAQTTPNDQALLLRLILDGSRREPRALDALGVTPELCGLALQIMSWQRYRTKIPGLLPLETRVANKTGWGRNGVMDAGIVYRKGEPLFILAAYTHGVPATMPDGLPGYASAIETIARLSRACWDLI